MIEKSTDKEIMTTWDRQRFFMDTIAWGKVTDQTRLIFVGVEDGGQGWVRGRAFGQVDYEILGCIDKANKSFVPHRYIVPSGASQKQQITEKFQCSFALELRRVLDIFPSPPVDPESYYRSEFLNQFELAANLFPFAKPSSASSFDEQTRKYIGLSDPASPLQAMSKKELIAYRLDGICRLRHNLALDGRLLVMVLMGRWTRPQYIRRQIVGEKGCAVNESIQLQRKKQIAECVKMGRMIYCFVPHPSYNWVSEEDARNIVDELDGKKWFD